MKYIKDFFYSLSDLFMILLILAVAGGLIYWRVNIIMDYPEALAAELRDSATQVSIIDETLNGEGEAGDNASEAGENTNENGEDTSSNTGEENGESGESGENGESGESNSEGEQIDTSSEQEPGSGPRDNTIWKDGKLRVDMNVVLESGSSEIAVESLVQAGLFSSYEDYEAVCEKAGLDPGMVRAGSYTFESGSTQEDIAETVTID